MDNVTYIINWFLENNQFLINRNDKEKMLKVLVFYTVLFEKFANVCDDKIIKINHSYNIISNDAIINETSEFILKSINVEFANLEYDDLIKNSTYYRFFNTFGVEDGELTYEWLSAFSYLYDHINKHYKNYNFNKYTYKIKNKVFYSINELNEEEINQLRKIPYSDEQLLWEVVHEDGKMFWW